MHWFVDDFNYRDNGEAEVTFGPPECPNDRMIGESCDFFDLRTQNHKIKRLIQRRDPENLADGQSEKWDLIFWREKVPPVITLPENEYGEREQVIDRTAKWSEWIWVERSAPWFPKRRDKRVKLIKFPGLVGNLARAIAGGMSRRRLWQVVDYHSKKKELAKHEVSMLWNLVNRRRELDMIDMAVNNDECRAAIAIFQFLYAPCKAAKALVAGLRTLDYPEKPEFSVTPADME